MEKKENTLNGFEAIFDTLGLSGDKDIKDQMFNNETDDDINNDATEELTDEELEALTKRNKVSDKKDDQDKDDDINDQDDDADDDSKQKSDKSDKKDKSADKQKLDKSNLDNKIDDDSNEDDDNNDDSQPELITNFFDAISEKIGWDPLDDEEKPKTAEELVEYFQEAIKESSVPEYANEEIAKLDKFVHDGGNIKDYLLIDRDIDWDNLEIEDNEENQKLVLKEFLKEKNYKSSQIDKKITKYEEAGILEDEATDAQEQLLEIKADRKEQLLKELQKMAAEIKEQQQAFFTDVVSEIKGMDSIYGIKVPEKDKKNLMEYIFKPDADGNTKYKKDFEKSRKNLIASAYFMMKGDNLIDSAKKEGKKDALNNFKNSLTKNNGINKHSKKQTIDTDDSNSIWESFTRNFRAQ